MFQKFPNIIRKWFEISQIFRNNNVFNLLYNVSNPNDIFMFCSGRGCWVAWGG